jgi:putative tricarboxylic transport membrane protein
METRPLVRADLVAGVVLLVFGLAVLAEAWGMPRLEERNINPWTAPGIVPGMLGIIIAVCGAVLALRSLAAGALHARSGNTPEETAEARASLWRLAICAALCVGYAVVLVGRLPFWLATAAFVFAFVAAFEWSGDDGGAARVRKLVAAAAVAAATAIVIPYSFEYLFLVRLP